MNLLLNLLFTFPKEVLDILTFSWFYYKRITDINWFLSFLSISKIIHLISNMSLLPFIFSVWKGVKSHNTGFALGLMIFKVLSCLKTLWILNFKKCGNENKTLKCPPLMFVFKRFFPPKTIIGEASNCDWSIPHPFLWIHPNVLSWGVRLCSLREWGFALQLWSRQEGNKPLLLQSVQANHSTSKFFFVPISLTLYQIKLFSFKYKLMQ